MDLIDLQDFFIEYSKTRKLPYRYVIKEDIKIKPNFGGFADVTIELYKIENRKSSLIKTYLTKGKKEEAVKNAYYSLLSDLMFNNLINNGT